MLAVGLNAQNEPTIVDISEDQEVELGGRAEFGCSVQFRQDYSVNFLKHGKTPTENVFLTFGSVLVIKDSRFSVLVDESAAYTVLLKDVQEHDAGIYECEVVLSVNNKLSVTTELFVLSPPIILDNSTQSITATTGDTFDMECYATGLPPPKIMWLRPNNELLPYGEFTSDSWRSIIGRERFPFELCHVDRCQCLTISYF